MKYKRVVITRSGGPEVLQLVEDELPEPKAGEIRVKILATGVAFTDVMTREGVSPPLFPNCPILRAMPLWGLCVNLQRLRECFKTQEIVDFSCASRTKNQQSCGFLNSP